MATASAYDQWEDPGLAFGEDEIAGHVVSAVAEARVNWLLHMAVVIEKLLAMPDAPKRQWWMKVQAKMVDTVTWYCRTAELQGIDRGAVKELPLPSSPAGKSLAKDALDLMKNEEEFVAVWNAQLKGIMVQHVTIGRRCASAKQISKWSKKESSLSNKIANAITKEMDVAMQAAHLLSTLSS